VRGDAALNLDGRLARDVAIVSQAYNIVRDPGTAGLRPYATAVNPLRSATLF